ncbi:MAG: STAS domain-containing protein [Deltaproteobacteria bacterium]
MSKKVSLPMPNTLNLAPRMNFQAAKELYGNLTALANKDVEIDATGVEFLGGLAAQTIIVAQRDWGRGGHSVVVRNCTPAFRQSLDELGLSTFMTTEGGSAC